MSIILTGVGVSSGICIGDAIIVNKDNINYSPSYIRKSQVKDEIKKFENALSRLRKEYQKSINKIKNNQAIIKLMDMQLTFVNDNSFKNNILKKIKNECCTVNWSISSEYLEIKKLFASVEDKYIKERLADIKQMIISLLDLLQSKRNNNNFNNDNIKNKIIITDEITPKDVIDIHHSRGLGIICSHGSKSSHSSILSKSLALPMIINVSSSVELIKNTDALILDAANDNVIVNPSNFEVKHYRKAQSINRSLEKSYNKLAAKKAVTRDRIRIDVMSNLELSEEVKLINSNTDGIGLFRTEYLYMNRNDLPTEAEQIKAYKKVFNKALDKPVTLRTLDIGSDKEVSENIRIGQIAKNPALGLRGIRYSLIEKNVFKTQIKAMLRAGLDKKLRILIPMITSLDEINQVKKLINEAKTELDKQKKNYVNKYELGIMIEVPASAIQAGVLSKHVDFMSIGTNDLVQYILATDRIDDEVTNLYDPSNPAVLRIIKDVIDKCEKSGIDVAVCGEMASEKQYTRLLLGLGLKSFSMHPQAIPEIKNIIMNANVKEIKKKISTVLSCNDYLARRELVENL
jgi:phosphotransferase system enzyme I (PtsI)